MSVCVSSWGSDAERVSSIKWDLWADSGEASTANVREEQTHEPEPAPAVPVMKPGAKVETKAIDKVRPTETHAVDKTDNAPVQSTAVPERQASVKGPVSVNHALPVTDAVKEAKDKVSSVSRETAREVVSEVANAPHAAVQQRSAAVKEPVHETQRPLEPVAVQQPKTPVFVEMKEPAKDTVPKKTVANATATSEQPVSIKEPVIEITRPSEHIDVPQPKAPVFTEPNEPVKKVVLEKPDAGDMVGSVPVGTAADYLIGPGDILDISVWKDEALTRTVVVLPDGTINFPLIGKITVVGKTLNQAKSEMVRQLERYVPDLELSIEVKQSNSMIVYIIGRVNAPGRQVLNSNVNVLQALSMAGGLTPFANRNKIKVFRKNKEKTDVLPFRYNDVIDGKLATNVELERGDVIVVP